MTPKSHWKSPCSLRRVEGASRVGSPDDLLRYDARRLQILVARHAVYTGSEPAQRVLAQWRELAPKFVKIMPLDYRRALQDMQKARAAAHRDEPVAV